MGVPLDEFDDYAFPTLQAGAIYERQYLLGTSFARPVTAKYLVEVAEQDATLAGHIQITLFILLTLGLYTLWHIVTNLNPIPKPFRIHHSSFILSP